MKKLMLLAALAVLVAGQAWAQTAGTGVSARGSYYFNDKNGARTDADGRALVYDEAPNLWSYYSKIYSDTLCNRHKTADSTGVYPVGSYGSGVLYVYPITGGVQTDSLVLFIQVRGHFQLASDSSSTFPLMPWSANPFGTGPGLNDKIGHLNIVGGTVGDASVNGYPGWNEYTLVVKPDVYMQNGVASLPYIGKGIAIPLYNLWTPYISVRFRNGRAAGANNAAEIRTRLDVTYVGTPLK